MRSLRGEGAKDIRHVACREDGNAPIAKHQIGNHLFAGLTGGLPRASYKLELRDEAQTVVAVTTATSDREGDVGVVAGKMWTELPFDFKLK